jgi:hypothetical protein
MSLEASTKPHVHNLIHEFLINMAFTMACPNFKKGLKMISGPLGVNVTLILKTILLLSSQNSLSPLAFWMSKR